MSGAEVWDAIQRSVGGFWSMTRSQVYQELSKSVTAGWAVDREARFAVTNEGRSQAAQWFEEFALASPRADQVRSSATLTVFFGHYLSADLLARVVREHRLQLERRLDQLRRIEAAVGEDTSLPGATLRRGILNTTAAIEWTDDVTRRVSERLPVGQRTQAPGQGSGRR